MRVHLDSLYLEINQHCRVALPNGLRSPAWVRWWASVVACPPADRRPLWEQMPHGSPFTLDESGVVWLTFRPRLDDGRPLLGTPEEERCRPLDRQEEEQLLRGLREYVLERNCLKGATVDLGTLREASLLEDCEVSGRLEDEDLELLRCRGERVSARICSVIELDLARVEADDYLEYLLQPFFEVRQPTPYPRYLTAPVVWMGCHFAGEIVHCSPVSTGRAGALAPPPPLGSNGGGGDACPHSGSVTSVDRRGGLVVDRGCPSALGGGGGAADVRGSLPGGGGQVVDPGARGPDPCLDRSSGCVSTNRG